MGNQPDSLSSVQLASYLCSTRCLILWKASLSLSTRQWSETSQERRIKNAGLSGLSSNPEHHFCHIVLAKIKPQKQPQILRIRKLRAIFATYLPTPTPRNPTILYNFHCWLRPWESDDQWNLFFSPILINTFFSMPLFSLQLLDIPHLPFYIEGSLIKSFILGAKEWGEGYGFARDNCVSVDAWVLS